MKAPPLAIWLWYRGGPFKGFQRQPRGRTVQGVLLEALGATPNPAGRTDRGVHARMQVVSLGGGARDRPPDAVRAAIDRAAPGELGAALVRPAAASFHAQWQARGKEYRYRLSLSGAVPDAWRGSAWPVREHPRLAGRPEPAPDRVAELLRQAEGTRDFWALHAKSSRRKPRALQMARLEELGGGLFQVRLRGDSFARYQARILVGTAVAVACGAVSGERWAAALERAEEIDGIRAPAEGLVLWSVEYPEALDPFTPEERARAPGLPEGPPFDAG